jgi:1,4-alpha-glucan branching enzyme
VVSGRQANGETMRHRMILALPALLIASAFASATAGAPDNNVEWDGISHVPAMDRSPSCPVDGQAFEVRFQTYSNDLTSARVHVDDGTAAWTDASKTSARGPYDVWSATVPATGSTSLSYYIELTDGTDTDYLSVSGMSSETPTDGGFVVDYSTLEHAPIGATVLPDGGAVFKVWSPDRTVAHVRGEFNGWGTGNQMTKVGEHFIGRVPSAHAGQMYKYYFQNSVWNTDPRGRALNAGDNYNAYLMDPDSYDWQVDDFDVPDFEEMVVYQLHVGTFSGRNDPYGSAPFPARYVDVAARASHLAELGINAVMLCPITEFPGDYSAGYNPITQWAPEWKYGTPDDLKYMVDTLHAHGIAVILDIVWNHFSFSDNFLWNYDGTQSYFDDPAVDTPWGSQADFDNENVRDYFLDSVFHWLDEYRMDGFRMDATDYMNMYQGSGWSLMQEINDGMDRRAIDKITIAEQLPDDSWVTRPTGLGGAGFDSQYYDEFTDRLREEIVDAAVGDPEMWKIRNIINGGGEYLNGRYVTNYFELHDECWPSSGGQRMVKTIDTTAPHDDQWAQGRTKLAQGLVMTAPGIPAILQGTEWLEDADFGTGLDNRIDWSKKTTYAYIFDYYRDLITLRRLSPALRADAGVDVFHMNEGGNVIAFQRYDYSGHVHVIVANFSNTDYPSYRIGLPQAGSWVEEINSVDPAYGGTGTTNPGTITPDAISADGFPQSKAIALSKMALVVLTWGEGTGVSDGAVEVTSPHLLGVSPNPFNPRTTVSFELPDAGHARVAVFDVAGREVAVLADRYFEGGRQSLSWDVAQDGLPLPSGVYFVRLETDDGADLTKAVLLK